MYYKPYIKQLLETVKERQAQAAKNPDVDFMYEDFQSCISSAQKSLKTVPMKRQSIIDFLSHFRGAGLMQGHLAVLARKHLTENEALSFNNALQSDIDTLIKELADLVERLDQRDGRSV